MKPIEADWADKCPANPQLVQMYQSAQMDAGGMDDIEGDAEGNELSENDGGFGEVKDEKPDEENTEDPENVDKDAWEEIGDKGKDDDVNKSLTFQL